MHAGIDYGTVNSGNTVICIDENGALTTHGSVKNKNADEFIVATLQKYPVKYVFIDAPLSLPAAYFDKGSDFFYRQADKETSAMSPMFLGGLTARAIKLKRYLENTGVACIEVYPKQLKLELFKNIPYKTNRKDLINFTRNLAAFLPYKINKDVKNWHEADALLAWLSGWRYLNGQHLTFGNQSEGTTIV